MSDSPPSAGLAGRARKYLGLVWGAATHPDRVNCKKFFAQLDDYLDRSLSPDELARLDEHLAICHRCIHLHHFESGVLQQVRSKVQQIKAPESFKVRLLSQIRLLPPDIVEP